MRFCFLCFASFLLLNFRPFQKTRYPSEYCKKRIGLAEISTGNLIVIPSRNIFRSRRFSIDFFPNDLNRGQHLFLAYDSKERLGSYSIYLNLINSGKILKNLYHLII